MSDIVLSENIQGLDAGIAKLDEMIAADAAKESAAEQQTAETPSATEGVDRATPPDEHATQTSSEPKPDAPATAEQQKQTEQKSKFAKEVERREKSWAELNRQKEEFKKQQDELTKAREAFDAERKQIEAAKAESKKPKFTAEQYEAAAKLYEDQGKFDLADLARQQAKELRENPPKPEPVTDTKAKLEAERKEWSLKAAIDFPELAKDNSPLQIAVAQLQSESPELRDHPKGIYFATRLAAAEAAAAGAAVLRKELETATAKVKELEALTAPGAGGSAQALPGEVPFEQKSPAEQLADLQRMASGVMLR